MMVRLRDHHLQLPRWHGDTNEHLRALYGVRVTRDLVNKIALFFFPIFLFQWGVQAPELAQLPLSSFQKGMLVISAYYILAQATAIFTAIPIGVVIRRYAHERSLAVSHFLRAVVFSLLLFDQGWLWLLGVTAVLDGVQSTFFWSSYYTIASRATKKETQVKNMDGLQFVFQLATILSLAGAGLVARYLGMDMLFLASMVLSLLGGIFALVLRFKPEKDTVSFAGLRAWLQRGSVYRLVAPFSGRYLHDGGQFLWPLVVYFMVGAVDTVGYLQSLSLFLAFVVTFFIGTAHDGRLQKKLSVISGSLVSLVWLARTQIWGAWAVALTDALDRLVSHAHWSSDDALYIRSGRGSRAFSYFVYREIVFSAIGVVFWMLFGALAVFFAGWNVLFVLVSAGVLFSSIMTRHKE